VHLKSKNALQVHRYDFTCATQEKARAWQQTFGAQMNLNVVELTGDTENVDFSTLSNADLILATPEKLGKTHSLASHTLKNLPVMNRIRN